MPFIVRILVLGIARYLPKTMSNPVAVVNSIKINWQTSLVHRKAIF